MISSFATWSQLLSTQDIEIMYRIAAKNGLRFVGRVLGRMNYHPAERSYQAKMQSCFRRAMIDKYEEASAIASGKVQPNTRIIDEVADFTPLVVALFVSPKTKIMVVGGCKLLKYWYHTLQVQKCENFMKFAGSREEYVEMVNELAKDMTTIDVNQFCQLDPQAMKLKLELAKDNLDIAGQHGHVLTDFFCSKVLKGELNHLSDFNSYQKAAYLCKLHTAEYLHKTTPVSSFTHSSIALAQEEDGFNLCEYKVEMLSSVFN